MSAKEVWPFIDADSSRPIQEIRYYGFCDSGGFIASPGGYASLEACAEACAKELLDEGPYEIRRIDCTNDPSALGSVACCILTGRQFVDRLYELCSEGSEMSDFGTWSPE